MDTPMLYALALRPCAANCAGFSDAHDTYDIGTRAKGQLPTIRQADRHGRGGGDRIHAACDIAPQVSQKKRG
jgi:hypothetical protein